MMLRKGAAAFAQVPRWLFVGTVFYAPAAYGSVREWARVGLVVLLAAVVALWLVGLLLCWRRPIISKWVWLSTGGILALGWGMALNPHFAYDGIQHIFLPVVPRVGWAPGSVEGYLSQRMMIQMSALLGALLFVCDTASDPRWRRCLWAALCLAGVALVSFGLYHRATGVPEWLWVNPRFEFATYRYHPNAGAFINIVCGTTIGMIVLTFYRGAAWWKRAGWLLALVVLVAGGLVNASKAAQGLLLLLLLAACAWRLPWWWQARGNIRWRLVIPGAMAAAILTAAAVQMAGWQMAERRWKQMLAPGWSNDRRVGAYEVGFQMAADAGWFGFGPGTFQPVFPHYTFPQGDRLAGVWRELHMDYLQAIAEYGWIGAALWTVLAGGAVVRGARVLWRASSSGDHQGRMDASLAGGGLLALGATGLHALIDFPLQVPSLLLYVLTIMGCVWSLPLHRTGSTAEREETKPVRR